MGIPVVRALSLFVVIIICAVVCVILCCINSFAVCIEQKIHIARVYIARMRHEQRHHTKDKIQSIHFVSTEYQIQKTICTICIDGLIINTTTLFSRQHKQKTHRGRIEIHILPRPRQFQIRWYVSSCCCRDGYRSVEYRHRDGRGRNDGRSTPETHPTVLKSVIRTYLRYGQSLFYIGASPRIFSNGGFRCMTEA